MLQCKQSASTCKGLVSNKFNSKNSSSGETKISEYSKYCLSIRDSFSRKPCTGKITQHSSFESGTIQACQEEPRGILLKGLIQPLYAKISILAASVSYQRGMGQHTSNKFKTSEQFHPISAFQKGGTEFITKYAPEGGLHVQAGPKRLLLLCSSKKGIKEISMVSVRRDTLQVPLPLF